MMALLGTVVGASITGVASLAKSMAETYFPAMAAGRDNKNQMTLAQHAQRCEAVRAWRAGLCAAGDDYRQWVADGRDGDPPNVVGSEWFEGLRPRLPASGETAAFRNAHEVHVDNATLTALSLEIGRIEQEWVDHAGRRRRGRNRHE